MTILITGANGFIGKHLVRELRDSAELLTPRSFELDLLDSTSVDNFFVSHQIDFIVHSAASGVRITAESQEQVTLDNLRMFKNLAKHSDSHCPMLVLGSGVEYDKRNSICKVSEDEWLNASPSDPYGKGKYAISQYILDHDHICNLRIFGVYGMYEHPSRLPAYVLARCLANEDIVLNQNAIFDFIYVKDLCKIIRHFIENGISEKFINVCPNTSISIKDFTRLIVSCFPEYTGQILFRNKGVGKEYSGSNALLRSLVKNISFTSYEEGIRDYIRDILTAKV